MSMTRSEAASVAANTRWAFETDRAAATRAATEGFRRKFERLVDPEGVLPPAELAKRTDNAIRAHMTRVRAARRRRTTRT